jgi:hypothetical protein
MRASNIETDIPKMGIGFWVRTKGDSKTVSLNKHQLNLREYALKVMAGLKYIVLTQLMSITTFTALKQGTFCICYLPGRTPKDHETTFQHIHLLTNCSLRQKQDYLFPQSFIGAPPELKNLF